MFLSPVTKVFIDEAMIAWRGPLSFTVFNLDQADKFGIKLFELWGSSTAYYALSAVPPLISWTEWSQYIYKQDWYVDNFYISPNCSHT